MRHVLCLSEAIFHPHDLELYPKMADNSTTAHGIRDSGAKFSRRHRGRCLLFLFAFTIRIGYMFVHETEAAELERAEL